MEDTNGSTKRLAERIDAELKLRADYAIQLLEQYILLFLLLVVL